MSTVSTVNGPRECGVKPQKSKEIMELRGSLIWTDQKGKEEILMKLHQLGDLTLQQRDEAIERSRANG